MKRRELFQVLSLVVAATMILAACAPAAPEGPPATEPPPTEPPGPPFANEMVRQAIAMAVDRQRIVDTFYPPGSSVAQQFLPEGLLARDDSASWYEFDVEAARALLAEAGYPDGFTTTLKYRDVFRGYLPEPDLVAQDIAAQLQENLNITVEIVEMESGAFLDASDAGQLEGLHMLGWTGDYPDPTNFYDFHFGSGATDQFGDKFEDITSLLSQAAQLGDEEARRAIYAQVNELIEEHVPMVPIAHGASAAAYKATVVGAHASPLGNESLEVMGIPGQDTFTFMQNAEPPGLYCADETDGEALRVCEQIGESLLAYEVAGVEVIPSLATGYATNEDATVWTFTLREGVKFHDGSDFDSNDVLTSWLVQWDTSHALHVGRDGSFSYFSGLFGGFADGVTVDGGKAEVASCDYGGILRSIEAVDPLTVVFTTCVPDPSFPAKAAFSSFQIYPSEYLESTGGGGELVEHPIGTGPYMFEAWNRGDSVVLTRFDGYWGEPALSPKVVFRWSSEGAQKLIELQAGTVDGIDNVAPDDISTVENDPNLQLAPRAPFNIFYLGMNNSPK